LLRHLFLTFEQSAFYVIHIRRRIKLVALY